MGNADEIGLDLIIGEPEVLLDSRLGDGGGDGVAMLGEGVGERLLGEAESLDKSILLDELLALLEEPLAILRDGV